jgi:hypothetical protein
VGALPVAVALVFAPPDLGDNSQGAKYQPRGPRFLAAFPYLIDGRG